MKRVNIANGMYLELQKGISIQLFDESSECFSHEFYVVEELPVEILVGYPAIIGIGDLKLLSTVQENSLEKFNAANLIHTSSSQLSLHDEAVCSIQVDESTIFDVTEEEINDEIATNKVSASEKSHMIDSLFEHMENSQIEPTTIHRIKDKIKRAFPSKVWAISQEDFDSVGLFHLDGTPIINDTLYDESKESQTRLAFPAFKTSQAMGFIMKKALDELLRSGRIKRVFQPSRYAAPVFMHAVRLRPKEECDRDLLNWKTARPPSGESMEMFVCRLEKFYSFRLVYNYKSLNSVTLADPVIMDDMDLVRTICFGKRWFATLDFKSFFNQIRNSKETAFKSTFITPFGCFEPVFANFGPMNIPSLATRILDELCQGLDKATFKRIDDILVAAETIEELCDVLCIIGERVQKMNGRLNLKKVQMFRNEIVFCNRVITSDGIRLTSKDIQKIRLAALPSNRKELQSALGLIAWCKDFIPHLADHEFSLTELLKVEKFEFSEKHRKSFETCKYLISNHPLLSHPDPEAEWVLITDASPFGLASILSQRKYDKFLGIIGFYSRKWTEAERNYSQHEKELVSVVCSCTHFLYWLEYRPFTVLVDARSLLPLELGLGKKRKFARHHAVLDRLTFSMKAIPGCKNPADYGTRFSDDMYPELNLEEDKMTSFYEEGLLKYFRNDLKQCVLSQSRNIEPPQNLVSLSLTDGNVHSTISQMNCGLVPQKCDVIKCSHDVFIACPECLMFLCDTHQNSKCVDDHFDLELILNDPEYLEWFIDAPRCSDKERSGSDSYLKRSKGSNTDIHNSHAALEKYLSEPKTAEQSLIFNEKDEISNDPIANPRPSENCSFKRLFQYLQNPSRYRGQKLSPLERKIAKRLKIVDDELVWSDGRYFPSEIDRIRLLREAHGDDHKQARLMSRFIYIEKQSTWPGLLNSCNMFLKGCSECVKSQRFNSVKVQGVMSPAFSPGIWAVDFVERIVLPDGDVVNVVVFTEEFSKKRVGEVVLTKEPLLAFGHFLRLIMMFPDVYMVKADKAFDCWEPFLYEFDIEYSPTLANESQGNAIAENSNLQLFVQLERMQPKNVNDLIAKLPLALKILNSTPLKSLGGRSPDEVFFGLPSRQVSKLDLPRDNKYDAEVYHNLEQFRLSMLESVFQTIGRNRIEPSTAPVLYSEGSLVMAWKARQTKRPHLEFRNEGPYKVVKQKGWKVELQRDDVKLEAHLNHIYPYIPSTDIKECPTLRNADATHTGKPRVELNELNDSEICPSSSAISRQDMHLQQRELGPYENLNELSTADREAIKRVVANDARDRRAELRRLRSR